MAVELLLWAFKQPVPRKTRNVWLELAYKANSETFVAFPHQSTLAKATGESIRTVKRVLKKLEQTGDIRREATRRRDGRRGGDRYHFPNFPGCQIDTLKGCQNGPSLIELASHQGIRTKKVREVSRYSTLYRQLGRGEAKQ